MDDPLAGAPGSDTDAEVNRVSDFSSLIEQCTRRGEKTNTTHGGDCVPCGFLRRGSSVDRLLVAAIWPDAAPAPFAFSDRIKICVGHVGVDPFAISAQLARQDDVIVCDYRGRRVGSFRPGIPIDYY